MSIFLSAFRLFTWVIVLASHAQTKSIRTNAILMDQAPSWVTESMLNQVTDKIESKLEWDIRKIRVTWYLGPDAENRFQAMHGVATGAGGNQILAFARRSDSSVHLGPKVNRENFSSVFGHELVHVILNQKYKANQGSNAAIPAWLEEGLANYLTGRGKVNYSKWANRTLPDFHQMIHPFAKTSALSAQEHYELSRCLIEFIASKCDLNELIQLSVGKNLENYLPTFCTIKDLNGDFKKWILKKSK